MTYSCIPIPSGFIFAIDGMAYYKVKQSDDVWFCFRVGADKIGAYGVTCPGDDFNTLLSIEYSIEDAIEYIVAICNREVDYIDKDTFKHTETFGRKYTVDSYYDKWMVDLGYWDETPWGPVYESEQEAVSIADRLNYERMVDRVGRDEAKKIERRYMLIGIIKDRLTYKPKPKKTTPPAISLFA